MREERAALRGKLRYASLPPERFPNCVALAAPLTAGAGDERFGFGLDALAPGIATMSGP